jgi:hypothetical protein
MMIDSHPAVAIPPETGFLPVLADLDRTADAGEAAWRIMTGYPTWPDFQMDPVALRQAIDRTSPCGLSDAARMFYRLYAARFGKSRWGDKTPTYGTAIDRIASLLPESHFIHVIRDGRDVTVSVRRLWFRPGNSVEACAADWASRIAATRAAAARVARYLEVRYESLVTSTEETLREICRFLDLPFDAALLAYHVRAGARLDEHEARRAPDGDIIVSKAERRQNQRLVMEPPRADRIGRWTSALGPDEVLRFEAIAGDWLDRLGYARASASL